MMKGKIHERYKMTRGSEYGIDHYFDRVKIFSQEDLVKKMDMNEKRKKRMKEQLQEKKVCRTMLIENLKKDAWWYDEVKVAVDEKNICNTMYIN